MRWKPEARVLGFDDGPHERGDETVPVVGVVTRAASGYVEAVLRTDVHRDGDDATDALVAATRSARVYPNVVAVLTHNSTMAGFNTLDLERLARETERPVVAASRGPQDWSAMRDALLSTIPNGAAKWQRIEGNEARQLRRHGLTLVPAGVEPHEAADLVDLCRVRGHLPEPIRLAHLIAAGWVLGESRGQ